MPRKHKSKKPKGKLNVKFPNGAEEVPLKQTTDSFKIKDLDKDIVSFVDELASSAWEPYISRPRHDLVGFCIVCQWFSHDQTWVILYLEHGNIRSCLEHLFSRFVKTPIAHYLSSLQKESKNLIWLKWLKDPLGSTGQSMNFDKVMTVISERYNWSEKPAFNMVSEPEEELPSDFSIVSDWKPKKKEPKEKTTTV